MSEWAEKKMKGVSSMQAVRDLASKLEKERKEAEDALPHLEQSYNNFAIAELRKYQKMMFMSLIICWVYSQLFHIC